VHWFRAWEPSLDEALAELPELPTCPHETYRAICENPGRSSKRIALVLADDSPVALVGLRRRGPHSWEPVTQWIVPHAICPARDEDVLPALVALRRELAVVWWRMGSPPRHPWIRDEVAVPVHRLRIDERVAHWRTVRQWRNVVAARRKCADFTVSVDDSGAAEWVIRNCTLLRGNADDARLEDRLLAARHLERAGIMHTVTLSRGGERSAGASILADGDTVTAGLFHREPVAGNLPTGVRLIDATFDLAEALGFLTYDLGGGHAYKAKWAPQEGMRYSLRVAPPAMSRDLRRMADRVGRLTSRMQARLGHDRNAAAPFA
jgi:hypothetical protein